MHTIPEAQTSAYLLASLRYSALSEDLLRAHLSTAVDWYRHLAGQGHYHLPFFLVLDLGVLLHEGHQTRFASLKHFQAWPEEERTLRLRYENEWLSRFLQNIHLQTALEMLQTAPNKKHLHLRLMDLLWRSLAPNAPRDVLLHPAQLRGISFSSHAIGQIEEAHQRITETLPHLPSFGEQLSRFLHNAAQKLRWSELLHEEDLFELAHFEQLNKEALRIGCRQLIEIERRLGEIDLRELPVQDESADSETAFVDETYYPTGGISEITTRGAFENLVLSELIYMESKEEIDLFDLRFVEGELLFYTRDAGLLRRKRRTVHLILDLGEIFALKSGGYDYQFSILLLGFCLRLIRDLTQYFEHDALQFHIHCLHGSLDPTPFQQDLELLKLRLHDEIQHDSVHLHLTRTLKLSDCLDPQRKVYAVALCYRDIRRWHDAFAHYKEHTPAIHGILFPILHPISNTHPQEPTHAQPIPSSPLPKTSVYVPSGKKRKAALEKKRAKKQQKADLLYPKSLTSRSLEEEEEKKEDPTPSTENQDIHGLSFSFSLPIEGASIENLAALRTQLIAALVA